MQILRGKKLSLHAALTKRSQNRHFIMRMSPKPENKNKNSRLGHNLG